MSMYHFKFNLIIVSTGPSCIASHLISTSTLWEREREGESQGGVYMYNYGWFEFLFGINQCNIVKNKLKTSKKKRKCIINNLILQLGKRDLERSSELFKTLQPIGKKKILDLNSGLQTSSVVLILLTSYLAGKLLIILILRPYLR